MEQSPAEILGLIPNGVMSGMTMNPKVPMQWQKKECTNKNSR